MEAGRILAVSLLLLCVAVSEAAVPPKAHPRREDVKFIKCEICKKLAANAFGQAHDLMRTPDKPKNEEAIIELMEKVTTAWRPEGEWITTLHLAKSLTGKTLNVKNMRQPGDCGEACKTIERAAQDVMGDHDTDLAEALFVKKHKDAKAFSTWLCNELSGACSAAVPPLPSGHKAYPAFRRASDGQNVDRVLGQMADAGMKGKMYTRDELMEKYQGEMGANADGHDGSDL